MLNGIQEPKTKNTQRKCDNFVDYKEYNHIESLPARYIMKKDMGQKTAPMKHIKSSFTKCVFCLLSFFFLSIISDIKINIEIKPNRYSQKKCIIFTFWC